MTTDDDAYPKGRAAIVAFTPAVFDWVKVEAEETVIAANIHTPHKETRIVDELREKNPKPVLWKTIDMQGFGCSRNLRFGHLVNKDRYDQLWAFDNQFNPLWNVRPCKNTGHFAVPYDFDGTGRDDVFVGYIRLSPDGESRWTHGGMIDGHGRRVVVFPNNGHLTICAESINLVGDACGEIVLLDTNRIWIDTQDTDFNGDKINKPNRHPPRNTSNYRAEISLPGWEKVMA